MERITLTAPDISCDHCINAIRKAVTTLPSVQMLSGDPDTKLVTLEFDPEQTPLDDIEAAMEEEGYPVSSRN
jgi:copper chaperone